MSRQNTKIDQIKLLIIVACIAVIGFTYFKVNEDVRAKAEKITEIILNDKSLSLANTNILNEVKLKEIQNMNYKDLKNSLNVKDDFCLYIEDEKGNIILSKGFNKLTKDGVICKE